MTLITLITLFIGLQTSNPALESGRNDSMELRQEKGHTIMKTVFDRFHTNYEMSRMHKMGYYQESVIDSSAIYYLAEGIVEIYIPSNLNHSENASIYPVKTRKEAYDDIEEEKLLFGNASDMARSSIWRPNSFLNEKNRDNYQFALAGEASHKGEAVKVIDFEPIDATHGSVKGKIFIDPMYYGIVKIEYTPIVKHSKVWQEVSWTEEFDFRNGAYELTQVKFWGISLADDFHYQAILGMNQLETVSEIPQNQVYIGDDTPLFQRALENDDRPFWEGFEYLKVFKPKNIQLVANQ